MTDDNDPFDLIGSDLVKEDPSFEDIVVEFIQSLSDRLEQMNAAISERDFDALRNAAHQLKGTGGGYGYPSLTERAADLEQQAAQRSVEECELALARLSDMCERIVARTD